MHPEPSAPGIAWSVATFADASALLQDMRHGANSGADGILGVLARAGRILMSAEAVDEVDEHLADVAGNPAREAAMRALWAQYREQITIVEGGIIDLDVEPVAALAARDPDDLHLVAAAGQRTSAVILSEDLDLRDLGLAPPSWLDGARDVMTISYGDLTVHVAGRGVALAAEAVAGTLGAAWKGSVSALLAVAAAVGVVVYVAADPRRRQSVLRSVMGVLEQMGEIDRDRRAAIDALSPYIDVARGTAAGVDGAETGWLASAGGETP